MGEYSNYGRYKISWVQRFSKFCLPQPGIEQTKILINSKRHLFLWHLSLGSIIRIKSLQLKYLLSKIKGCSFWEEFSIPVFKVISLQVALQNSSRYVSKKSLLWWMSTQSNLLIEYLLINILSTIFVGWVPSSIATAGHLAKLMVSRVYLHDGIHFKCLYLIWITSAMLLCKCKIWAKHLQTFLRNLRTWKDYYHHPLYSKQGKVHFFAVVGMDYVYDQIKKPTETIQHQILTTNICWTCCWYIPQDNYLHKDERAFVESPGIPYITSKVNSL